MKKAIVIGLLVLTGLIVGVGLLVEERPGETSTPTVTPTCAPRYYRTEGAHIVGEMAEVNGTIVDICN